MELWDWVSIKINAFFSFFETALFSIDFYVLSKNVYSGSSLNPFVITYRKCGSLGI